MKIKNKMDSISYFRETRDNTRIQLALEQRGIKLYCAFSQYNLKLLHFAFLVAFLAFLDYFLISMSFFTMNAYGSFQVFHVFRPILSLAIPIGLSHPCFIAI